MLTKNQKQGRLLLIASIVAVLGTLALLDSLIESIC